MPGIGDWCEMLVVADAPARSSPHPPLPCCRIIFNVSDHAAAGAGGRRLQKERVLKKGQPNRHTSTNVSCSPNSQRPWYCQWFPRLSCRWQWRLWTPHTQPLDLVQHVMFLFPPQVSWFSPRAPVTSRVRALYNIEFPASRTKFSLLICVACPVAPEKSPSGPGRGLCSGWLVPADVESTLSGSTSRVGHGQPAARVSRVVLEKVNLGKFDAEAFSTAPPPLPVHKRHWQFLNLDCVPRCAGGSTHPLPVQSKGVVSATKQPGNLKPEVERGGGGGE